MKKKSRNTQMEKRGARQIISRDKPQVRGAESSAAGPDKAAASPTAAQVAGGRISSESLQMQFWRWG